MGPVLGPQACTDRTRGTRVAEPWLPAPEDRRPGEGQRLTPGAPQNGGRHPPRGRPPNTPAARSPHRACRPTGQCWAPTPTRRRPQHVGGGPQQPAQGAGSRGRDSARPQTPLIMVEGTPRGDALPPPPQRATPVRRGACCGAGAGSPRPHRPHPGNTGRRTPATRSRGRAASGGTAPDTRRPSQCWKAPPPGTPFCRPHSEQRRPARAHAVGPMLGPHARTDRTRDTRVAEPWLPAPEDGRPGEGQRLTPDAPHNGGRHPPRGRPSATPTASNADPQGRTLWGPCWVPTPAPTAPGTHGSRNPGCPLQRTGGRGRDSVRQETPLTTVAGTSPGDGPPRLQRHAAPTGHTGQGDGVGPQHPHTRAHSTWVADPNSPPSRRAVGGGPAPDLRRPSQWWKAPLPETPFHHPHSEHRRPAMAHAVPLLAARPLERAAGVLRTVCPGCGRCRPGDPAPVPQPAPLRTGVARCGAGAGSPHPHQPHPGPAGRGTLATRSRERAAGRGTAPEARRPSQRWQASPPGDSPHDPRGTQPP